MKKYFIVIFISLFILSGCSNVPSIEEIEGDLKTIDAEIKEASQTVQEYSGGLLAVLANVRLETLKTTQSILEQKRNGLRRYIPLSYSIDGKKFTPPENKNELLRKLNEDLKNLKNDLSKAKEESAKYGGGLLGVLALAQVATVENSIAFLNQRRLLLKHDIPYYGIVPAPSAMGEPDFKPTPGEDVNKF